MALLVLALVAAGCSSEVVDGRALPASGSTSTSPSAPPAVPTGEFTWGETAGEVSNLMPLISAGNTTANSNLTVRVLDGLYRTSPQVAYVPDADQGIASASTVGGQQVVQIKINPDAVWSDGRPITADDYEFTISTQRSADPSAGGCAALLSTAGYDQVERTQKVSAKELKVYFKTPYADWKGLFSGAGGSAPLLSAHVLRKATAGDTCAAITSGWPVAGGIPLGAQNGPWLLTGQLVDAAAKTITLVPNPRYWGDKPKLAKLVYRTLDDASAAVSALRNGAVDAVYPTPQLDLLSQLRQTPDVAATVSFGSSFEHLDFNTADPLLKYIQIRQAIGLAVDRKTLVAQTAGAFSDRTQPLGNRLLLSTQTGYADNSGQYNSQNLAGAKRLIESVGGRLGADGIYVLGGRRLSFRVMTTTNNPVRDKTISVLAGQVRAAGVELTEFANPDIFEGPEKPTSLNAGGFQITLFAWVGAPAISTANPIYQSPASQGGAVGQNYSRAGTPQIDSGLKKVATALTPSTQIDEANAVDKLLWDQMATLPLYQKPTLLAFQDNVKGLADNATLAGPMWNSDLFTVK